MKQSFGYTLAEVLITLAIVGIIAALTLPTLNTNAKRQTYAKTLAVAVSDFEAAMKNMMEREDVDSIKETRAWMHCNNVLNRNSSDADIQTFVNDLSPYIDISSFDNTSRSYRFLNSRFTWNVPGIKFKTKKGPEYDISLIDGNARDENTAYASGASYIEQAATVSIDINGNAAPNMIGRDLFFYELGANGTLYPYGSKDYNFYHGNDASSSSFANGCGGAITSTCSEYLRQNGYKMDY